MTRGISGRAKRSNGIHMNRREFTPDPIVAQVHWQKIACKFAQGFAICL